jgi:hypothetical protein
MAKMEDITDRLHSLKNERRSTRRPEPVIDTISDKDFQFRPLARDNYVIFIYITLGVAIFGQLVLILFIG